MDRFSSQEEPEWQKWAFNTGVQDRRKGISWGDNPMRPNSKPWASWNAGWTDEDSVIKSEKVAP